jgi:tripartite ATP-independent transporter DctP family solute receptor
MSKSNGHNQLNRRQFVRRTTIIAAGSLSSMGILTTPSRGADFTLKYANEQPIAHPTNIRAREAIDKIKAQTNGKVEIQLFPNNVLGGGTDLISQVRSGAIDFLTQDGLLLESVAPSSSAINVGFAFTNYQQVWNALDGDFGEHMRSVLAKINLHAFDKIWDNGFRQVTSSTKPIVTPSDFSGFKIRVPVGPLQVSMFKALGAAPVSINVKDAYTALQTHLADGQENALPTIDFWKFYEVQKYCSLTSHMWDGFWMLANQRSWGKLPSDVQEIITRNWNEAALKQRQDLEQLDKSLQSSLETKGLIFNKPDTELFRRALRDSGFYAEWREKFGTEVWGLLEKHVGKLV